MFASTESRSAEVVEIDANQSRTILEDSKILSLVCKWAGVDETEYKNSGKESSSTTADDPSKKMSSPIPSKEVATAAKVTPNRIRKSLAEFEEFVSGLVETSQDEEANVETENKGMESDMDICEDDTSTEVKIETFEMPKEEKPEVTPDEATVETEVVSEEGKEKPEVAVTEPEDIETKKEASDEDSKSVDIKSDVEKQSDVSQENIDIKTENSNSDSDLKSVKDDEVTKRIVRATWLLRLIQSRKSKI